MTNVKYQNSPLSNEELMRRAPSIFATAPYEKMSSRYSFIPTVQVIDRLRNEGFQPYDVMQSRTRVPGKAEFTKHLIRFRDTRQGNEPAIRALGQIYSEMILTNSHDGASTYQIDAGLFRLVCLNGMVTACGSQNATRVRHSGNTDGIIEATYEIMAQFPAVLESVEQFSQLQLSAPQQKVFAAAALELKYDAGESPITPELLIAPRRREDVAPTLWNTFNVAQENLLQGGLRGRNTETSRRVKTRPVNGISENTRLNKALWTLTSEMAKLVA